MSPRQSMPGLLMFRSRRVKFTAAKRTKFYQLRYRKYFNELISHTILKNVNIEAVEYTFNTYAVMFLWCWDPTCISGTCGSHRSGGSIAIITLEHNSGSLSCVRITAQVAIHGRNRFFTFNYRKKLSYTAVAKL